MNSTDPQLRAKFDQLSQDLDYEIRKAWMQTISWLAATAVLSWFAVDAWPLWCPAAIAIHGAFTAYRDGVRGFQSLRRKHSELEDLMP